jgi:PAS domain S-box-containing protein
MTSISIDNPKERSLSRDLTIALILTIAVVSSVTISLLIYNDTIRGKAELNEKGDYLITILAGTLGTPLWNLDGATIQSIGSSYAQNELISRITIKGNEGKTYFSHVEPGDDQHINRASKIMYEGKPVGFVEISLTSKYSIDASRQILKSSIGTILITLLVLMVMTGFLLRRFLNKPLKQLGETVKAFGLGEYDYSVSSIPYLEFKPLVAVLRDMGQKITSQIEELRSAEKKYRDIFENAAEGIYQSTPDGQFITANPAMAMILGYDSVRDLIESIKDIQNEMYVDKSCRDEFRRILAEQGFVDAFEIQAYCKDGRIKWLSLNTHSVYDDEGKIALYEGIAEDITERKQAGIDLVESRHYLEKIINSAADPIFAKDTQHCFVLINDALCNFLGIKREELMGKTDYDFFPKSQADIFREKDKMVLTTGGENTNEEQITDVKGIVHTIVTKKTLYTDDKGNKFIVGIIRDISERIKADKERKRLEALLVQAQKMEAIGTMAGGIAHDFNNILSAIIGFSELAIHELNSSPDPSVITKHIKEVLKAGGRAKDLVRQILTFSRSAEVAYSPIELGTIVKESLRMLRSIIPSTINITQDLSYIGMVMSNPTQIHQVMMNLSANAVHAMDEAGGVLDVSLTRMKIDDLSISHELGLPRGSYVRLSVSDTGHGMPPDVVERIFEPYFTTKEMGKGTGLGLSVVHGIVKGHGGSIICRSTLGKGTVFDTYLPEIESGNEVVKTQMIQAIVHGTENILFVDDEPVLNNLGESMLNKLGYKVVTSASSIEALEIFREKPHAFDLVITDMTMPVMTGERLAQKILEIRSDMKIILCTGYSEHISEEKAKEIGIRELIMKPFEMNVLADTVRKVLDERHVLN